MKLAPIEVALGTFILFCAFGVMGLFIYSAFDSLLAYFTA